jgi:hypothetical protein
MQVVSAAVDIKSTPLPPQGCPIAATPLDMSPVWDLSPDKSSFKTMYIMVSLFKSFNFSPILFGGVKIKIKIAFPLLFSPLLQPTGTLSERLAAVASAATLARNAQVNFIVVWPEGGDIDFAAAWSDLYQSPKLPTGPFPSGKYSLSIASGDPQCTVHKIESYKDYESVENSWER